VGHRSTPRSSDAKQASSSEVPAGRWRRRQEPRHLRRHAWQLDVGRSGGESPRRGSESPRRLRARGADEELKRLRKENADLRMDREILRKAAAIRPGDDAVTGYRFVSSHEDTYPVERLCGHVGVSRSGYYSWAERGPSARTVDDACLQDTIRTIPRAVPPHLWRTADRRSALQARGLLRPKAGRPPHERGAPRRGAQPAQAAQRQGRRGAGQGSARFHSSITRTRLPVSTPRCPSPDASTSSVSSPPTDRRETVSIARRWRPSGPRSSSRSPVSADRSALRTRAEPCSSSTSRSSTRERAQEGLGHQSPAAYEAAFSAA
jgi:hypothetical protein